MSGSGLVLKRLSGSPEPESFILALDDALTAFSKLAPRPARVVELRYFGGMSEE